MLVAQAAHDVVAARADEVLHVLLGLARHAREREVDVDESRAAAS
jgi:hypothetical protein